MRVGVEVGGTFTDLVAVEGGRLVVTKVPITPKSPDVGAFAALTAFAASIAATATSTTATTRGPIAVGGGVSL